MTRAWDKVATACQWTALLVCLVLWLQGHPPAHAQDGTSSANTVQGLYLKEAISENNMAQLRAEQNATSLAVQTQDGRIRELEKAIASIDAKSTIFDPFIVALMLGNLSITAWKKKKSEA
jgi:hypothetical protein